MLEDLKVHQFHITCEIVRNKQQVIKSRNLKDLIVYLTRSQLQQCLKSYDDLQTAPERLGARGDLREGQEAPDSKCGADRNVRITPHIYHKTTV